MNQPEFLPLCKRRVQRHDLQSSLLSFAFYSDSGSANITRSIVAGNLTGGNISGFFTDKGNNLLSGATLLAPIGDYGGPTFTMPPLPGSPAIDPAPPGRALYRVDAVLAP